jgi:hypothetical protein
LETTFTLFFQHNKNRMASLNNFPKLCGWVPRFHRLTLSIQLREYELKNG